MPCLTASIFILVAMLGLTVSTFVLVALLYKCRSCKTKHSHQLKG
jgi:hypothetical protein